MGSRANIAMQMDGKRIYFYTHWSGYEVPLIVQSALERGKSRWDDAAYLARIMFCNLVGKDNWDELTGFGISYGICDNNYPIVVVNTDDAKVSIEADAGKPYTASKPGVGKSYSFNEYVAIEFGDNPWLFGGEEIKED